MLTVRRSRAQWSSVVSFPTLALSLSPPPRLSAEPRDVAVCIAYWTRLFHKVAEFQYSTKLSLQHEVRYDALLKNQMLHVHHHNTSEVRFANVFHDRTVQTAVAAEPPDWSEWHNLARRSPRSDTLVDVPDVITPRQPTRPRRRKRRATSGWPRPKTITTMETIDRSHL
jgi:hypothetical protein